MTTYIAKLENRGVIRLGGADRREFLQGMISNDIALCRPGQAVYAALLTPQGKFLHDMFVADAGEELLIDCEAARAEDLLKRLHAHKLRAKVVLEKANEMEVRGAWNGAAPGPEFFPDPRLSALGFRAIAPKGGAAGDFAAYDRHRLALGVADGSRDMTLEKSTLAEGNFDLLNGISWSKGCYMGQELTARMRYRGLVKKRLFPVHIEGAPPAPGTIAYLANDEIGEMRSSNGELGLTLLNIEKAELAISSGGALSCGDSRVTPHRPEWMKA